MLDLYAIAKIKPYKRKVETFYFKLFPLCNNLSLLAHIAYETSWGRYAIPGTNNLFNLRATKTWEGQSLNFGGKVQVSYRSYPDMETSVRDFLGLLKASKKYPGLFKNLNSSAPDYIEALCQGYYPKSTLPRLLSVYNDLQKVHLSSSGIKACLD